MGKQNDAFMYLATTGAGVAIGTDIDIAGFVRGSDLAGTLIVTAGGGLLLTMSADRSVSFANPIAVSGPVTMTSSAGSHFIIIYRKRSV